MPSFTFRGDDILVGPGFAVLAIGTLRKKLSGLGREDLRVLERLRRFQPVDGNDFGRALFDALWAAGAIGEGVVPRARVLRVPSYIVELACAPFTRVVGWPALWITLAISVGMWAAALVTFPSVTALNWTGAVAGIVLAIFAGGLAHEMGHAAVCLSKTGAVGSIRAGVSRVGPSFVVDITPIGQATRPDRILAFAFTRHSAASSLGLQEVAVGHRSCSRQRSLVS